jgi:selT/selW/selH-like putative selenoprotein
MPTKILIEICSNCKSHQWCTRHNEQQYENIANEVVKAIKEKLPDAHVDVEKVDGNRIGSFEIWCNEVEVFSKRTLGYFPHPEAVSYRIAEFIEGKLNLKDSSPIKRRPNTAE